MPLTGDTQVMATNNICKSKEDIDRFLACDPAHMPVVEANLRNVALPLCADDYNFFLGTDSVTGAQTGVDYFANPQSGGAPFNPRSMSRAAGLVRSGLKFRTDFILDSICVQVHCEPNAWALDGNQFSPQTTVDASGIPASPDLPWAGPDNPFGYYTAGTAINRVNAQLEWGGPTWRAAHWFLQAFRLKMQCPSAANVHELLNERLTDLGNCCLGTSYEGFGKSKASPIMGVRLTNGRLAALRAAAQFPVIAQQRLALGNGITAANQDVGYFIPFNCTQTPNEALGLVNRTPIRMGVVDESYGSQDVSPGAASKWYRLPIPRVIEHDENIEIILQTDTAGDIDFLDKMFMEMTIMTATGNVGASPVPGVNGLAETAGTYMLGDGPYTTLAGTGYVRIPGGFMRVGLALKGFMLDANVCSSVRGYYNNLTLAEAQRNPALAARMANSQLITLSDDAGGSMPGDVVSSGSCGCR